MNKPQRFTRERMSQRVEAFQAFVKQQGWDPGAQPRGEKGFLTFLVTDGQTSGVSVMFTPQGGIHLWGRSGPLKTRLVEWISQEQPGYIDHSAAWLSLHAALPGNTTCSSRRSRGRQTASSLPMSMACKLACRREMCSS